MKDDSPSPRTQIQSFLSLVTPSLHTPAPLWGHVHLGQIAYYWLGRGLSIFKRPSCGDLHAATAELLKMVTVWLELSPVQQNLPVCQSWGVPATLNQWPAAVRLAHRAGAWYFWEGEYSYVETSGTQAGFQHFCWREFESQNACYSIHIFIVSKSRIRSLSSVSHKLWPVGWVMYDKR